MESSQVIHTKSEYNLPGFVALFKAIHLLFDPCMHLIYVRAKWLKKVELVSGRREGVLAN